MSVSVLLFQSFHWWYLTARRSRLQRWLHGCLQSKPQGETIICLRLKDSLNSLHFKRAGFLTLCKQNCFTFSPYHFLWCQHFVALCIYASVWCEYHGIDVVKPKITPYWQKLPKTTQWISTRIVFLGLQLWDIFLVSLKIFRTAKHIPENRRRIQKKKNLK